MKKENAMNVQLRTYAAVFLLAGAVSVSASAFAADVAPVRDGKSCETPKYPRSALVNEEAGTVQMAFLVGTDGVVTESKVDHSSGSKSLDKAAVSAFSVCKFKPGTKDGKPEQMWVKMEFVWKLE
jgi:protein TonB